MAFDMTGSCLALSHFETKVYLVIRQPSDYSDPSQLPLTTRAFGLRATLFNSLMKDVLRMELILIPIKVMSALLPIHSFISESRYLTLDYYIP